MPRASPSTPDVHAKSAQWIALCMPMIHIFSSMRHPATPFRFSRAARVSMCAAGVLAHDFGNAPWHTQHLQHP